MAGASRPAIERPGSPVAPRIEPDRLGRRLARRHVEARLGTRVGGRVVGQPGALGDDPAELADLELGPLVAEQRQRDPLAADVGGRDVDGEQPLVVAAARRRSPAPFGPMTSEPPQKEIDSSTPTRLQKTTNDVVSCA